MIENATSHSPLVAIAYDEFPDITVEQEVLQAIDAQVLHIRNLSTPEALATARRADALMVTIQQVSADLLSGMAHCRIISRAGTGLDAIDIPAATARGIWVTSVPDYSVEEVSTHAIALLLAYARRLPQLINSTGQGIWDSKFVRPIPRLQGQTLGIVGFGRIGRAVSTKAQGLGLRVMTFDPFIKPEEIRTAKVEPVSWDTLLETADYISLHVPLTDQTRRIVNADALTHVKPTAFLINTARGALVDQDALLDAIGRGALAGAALDVLDVEPPAPNHPLLHHERIMVTPHIGWYSEAATHDVRVRASEEVVRVIRGERPRSPVNQIS